MERDPHQIIEGALICAYAVGAAQVFLYVRGEMALAQERLAQALNDAYAKGYVGALIGGTDFSCDVVLALGRRRLHRGRGDRASSRASRATGACPGSSRRSSRPPRASTCSPRSSTTSRRSRNLPWIVLNGGEAFAAKGAETSRGTRLFAVSGHVQRPGIYEVEFGITTYRDLLYDPEYGGGIREGRALKCFIPGGASAPWFFDEHLDLPLETGAVGKAGSMMGSGAVVVMDETTDAVRAAWRVVRFFANESCGKCTPCREGTNWLAKIMRRILDGYGRPSDLDLLRDVCDNISPGLAWPPRDDHHLPAGPVGRVAHPVHHRPLPGRVRRLHRRGRAAPTHGVRPGPHPSQEDAGV